MDNLEKMSRRKQLNPKPFGLKRSFSELLIDIAKSLNLPEDLSLKQRKPNCNSIDSIKKDDNQINGKLNDEDIELNNEQDKPKQFNKSKNDNQNNLKDLNSNDNSIDNLDNNSLNNDLDSSLNNSINNENGTINENNNLNELNKELNDEIDKQINDFNQNTLFSIFTERKLIKGQRFGPYLIKFNSTILDSNDDDKNSDNLKDKENQFKSNQIDSQSEINQTQSIQIQEPTGFWLKIIRTSSNQPTALIKIEENEIWLEILKDLNEQTELSIAKNYQFETLSKNLNKLNTSTMITDELLDSILEEEQLNGLKNDKENDLDDNLMNEEINNDEVNKNELNDKLNLINKNEQDITDVDNESEDSINRIDSSANFFLCKNCGIRFSNFNTLTVHQTNYCTKQQTDSISDTYRRLLASDFFKRDKRSIDDLNEPKPKKHQTEDTMCNNTSRDQLMVTGNSQLSNDVNSDSEELNKDIQDEQINNSNNSSLSLSNLQQNSSIDNQNGLLESLNSARILQVTMNLLSNLSNSASPNQDEQPSQQLNTELLETIQRLFNQNGNQSLANSLIAAANANQQRTNWFACKFCSFTTSKRQQLIKHVKTNCEGLMTAVANLQSTNNSSNLMNNSSSNSTNNTATNSPNSPTTVEQDENQLNNSATTAAANNQLSTAVMAAALSNEQLNSGCGNLICVNSNCTSNSLNGNNCVLLSNLPNTTNHLNNDKFKSIGPAEDSEDDYTSSSNPQDRYCMECEIQFASYKNYKVHKDIYCGSRHCSQKIQPPVNLINPRKRTISDTISNNNLPTSLASASTTSAVVNNITNLLGNQSSNSKTTNSLNNKTIATSLPTSKSPQKNLFNQSPLNNVTNTAVQQLSALCKNSSLLNLNANTSEAGSPNLQTTQQTANLQTSMATTTLNSNIPASLTSNVNMNAHQTAILNELFANGNIINLSQSINLIQQLSQPVYIAISTNPLILLPINSALNNNSPIIANSTANSSSNTNKSPSSTNNQDINEQSLNNQINSILNQTIDSLKNNSILNLINQQANQSNNLQLNTSSPINNAQRPGDEPMDLSAKRKCTAARLNSVASLLEQENLVNNPQLLKNIDALNALSVFNSQNAVDVAAAFLLPKTLNVQKPNIYSCDNCQINFHKHENYIVHKKHYCSATKQFEQQVNNLGNTQKQSPTPTDDLDSVNYLNSGPNSPQSSQSINHQQIINRTTSAASLSTLTAATASLVDSMNNQTSTNNKKLSTSLSITANKNSGCISPNNLSSNNSPVSSPPTTTFVSLQNNQLKSNSTTATNPIPQPSQPIYKCFCNKCGIRFTSQDNLFAHQTYYCINNNLNGSIINELSEVTCPKCRSVYGNEELFLTHICSANVAVSSQVSSVNNSSTNNTQTNSLSNINTSASNLLEAIESIKQQQQTLINSKLTSSLLNPTAVSNSLMNVSNSPLITANNLTSTSTSKSNNNNQAFKCTLCGYKGHTLRGMKTHVRVHGDQLQGAQEESFIIPLSNDNDCCSNLPLSNGTNCTNLNCRNTRLINQNANKRRRSTDPMSNILSNFVLPNNTNSSNSVISKELLLANSLNNLNNLNPILSNSLMNGLMNNLVNHLNNPLVSGLIGSNLNSNNSSLSANLLNLNSNNSAASSLNAEATSETEDNLDNSIQNNNSNGSLTCNGTAAVGSLSSNSNSIGKC